MKNLFLSIAVMFSFMGCKSFYKVQTENPVSINTFEKFDSQNKYLIVHAGKFAWHLTDLKISKEAFSGMLSDLPANRYMYITTKSKGGSRYKNTKKNDQSYVLEEVHLYLNATQFPELKSGNNIQISYAEIINAEVYTKDKGKTAASWLIPGIGIPVVVIVVASLLISSSLNYSLSGM
jgi:hypothetical protein